MSDLTDTIDVLAVHECGACGRRLPERGPSRYWCSETCQERWSLGRVVPESIRRVEPLGGFEMPPLRSLRPSRVISAGGVAFFAPAGTPIPQEFPPGAPWRRIDERAVVEAPRREADWLARAARAETERFARETAFQSGFGAS